MVSARFLLVVAATPSADAASIVQVSSFLSLSLPAMSSGRGFRGGKGSIASWQSPLCSLGSPSPL